MTLDLSNWMRDSTALHNIPITKLKIPGSHDSFSYSLTQKLPITTDVPSIVYKLRNLPCTKGVVYNWSVTQSLTVAQQLNAGIRYIDVRSAYYSTDQTFRAIHGLYGDLLDNIFTQISTWLRAHRGEIVVLDFNHFEQFDTDPTLYDRLEAMTLKIFDGQLLPPRTDPSTLTLAGVYATPDHGQIIIPFDSTKGKYADRFWEEGVISSPWANTSSLATLFAYLLKALNARSAHQLFVTQGILTPQTADVVAHLSATLKDQLALKATAAVETWTAELDGAVKAKVNIVMCDFVDEVFTKEIIGANFV